ncbi:MAG: flavodoxin family protein [Candidatus Lokiarchaeota archaeon]|nr:flavodoxin family protein [Candidatus Lokiarchaeota archaeon]
MSLKILGVSGSPVPNSNTDRAIKAILKASKLESEFVKLSDITVRPCRACKRCVEDNICKQEDDFPALASKVREASALVIGAYCSYNSLDAHTKAFLERLWSMRHQKNLNEGKQVVIVVSGVLPMTSKPVSQIIAHHMRMENMKVIETILIRGNVPCLTCGRGSECKMSGAPVLFGKGTKASSDLCIRVEDQVDVQKQINQIGEVLHDHLFDKKNKT